MIYSKCVKCELKESQAGRQTMITIEKYTESGMSVNRFFLCPKHEDEFRKWIETEDKDSE